MKKLLFSIVLFLSINAFGQVENPDRMIIHYADGSTQTVDIRGAESIEFVNTGEETVTDADMEKMLIGTWKASVGEAISSHNTVTSSLETVSLVFEEGNKVHYISEVSTTIHRWEDTSENGTYINFYKGPEYSYEVVGNVLKIKGQSQVEYLLRYDALTLTQLNGEFFPPVHKSEGVRLSGPYTYIKQ